MTAQIPEGTPGRVEIGWSRGVGWMSDLVARCDRIQDETGAWWRSPWSHVFWVFGWVGGPELIYESMVGRGIRIMPAPRLATSRDVESYARVPLDLTEAGRSQLWEGCCGLAGRAYDWRHVLRLYVYINIWGRGAIRQPWWMRLGLDDRYHCAEFVETTGRMAGLDLNYGHGRAWSTPATVTPHSLWRAQSTFAAVQAGQDVQPAGSP